MGGLELWVGVVLSLLSAGFALLLYSCSLKRLFRH